MAAAAAVVTRLQYTTLSGCESDPSPDWRTPSCLCPHLPQCLPTPTVPHSPRSTHATASYRAFSEDRQCHICQVKVLDLPLHTKMHHVESTRWQHQYMCSVCHVTFPTKRLAELHLRIHQGRKLYEYVENEKKPCSICHEKFTNLLYHVVTEHKKAKPEFRCYVCGTLYPEKNLYLEHLSHHLPSRCNCKQAKCYMCSSSDSEYPLFSCYVDEEDFMELGSPCEVCQLTVPNLKEHMESHDLKAPFQCSVCSVCFKDKEVANFHVNIHKRRHGCVKAKSSHCLICKKSGLASLYLHVASCHADVECNIVCPLCKMRFCEVQLYNLHVDKHFPAKCWCKHIDCYNCESQKQEQKGNEIREVPPPPASSSLGAGRKDSQSDELRSEHSVVQSQKSNIQVRKKVVYVNCEKCNIQMDSQLLEQHREEHDLSKAKFRCKVCKVTFTSSEMTQLHTGIHSCRIPKFEFDCTLCKPASKCLFKSFALIKHVKLRHWMEELKFSCFVCGHKFPEINAKTAHMELHAPMKCLCSLNKCKFCNYFKCVVCHQGFKKSEAERFVIHKGRCKTDLSIGKVIKFALKQSKSSDDSFSTEKNSPHEKLKTEVGDKPPDPRRELNSPYSLAAKTSSSTATGAEKSGVKMASRISTENANGSKRFSSVNEDNDEDDEIVSAVSEKNTKTPEGETYPVKRIARIQPYVQDEDEDSTNMPCPMEADNETTSGIVSSEGDDDDLHEEDVVEEATKQHSGLCEACGVVIRSGSLADHIKEQHPTMSYKCASCEITFKLKDQLLSHSMAHLNRQRVLCCLCHKQFADSNSWTAHVEAQHGSHLVCTVCMEVFGYRSSLRHHQQAYILALPRRFPCNSCCVSFHSFADLKEHKKLHGKECSCGGTDCSRCNKFKCTCGSTFKSHEFLAFRLHVMKCLQCYKCDAMFDTEDLLKMHERNHYAKCPVCGVAKRTSAQLEKHVSSHLCRCPADSAACLLCKKAWCVVCRKRFTPEELVTFKEHQTRCKGASLLCLCRDRDCFICSKHQCCNCGMQFRPFQVASFTMHKRKCGGSSVPQIDPFTKVKTEKHVEPVAASRKQRGTVERHVISLDSDDDDDQGEVEETSSEKTMVNRNILSGSVWSVNKDDDGDDKIQTDIAGRAVEEKVEESEFTQKQGSNVESSMSMKMSPLECYLLEKPPPSSSSEATGTEKVDVKMACKTSDSAGPVELDVVSSITDPAAVEEQDPIPMPPPPQIVAPIITIQPLDDALEFQWSI